MKCCFSALGLWTWSCLSWWLDELQSSLSRNAKAGRECPFCWVLLWGLVAPEVFQAAIWFPYPYQDCPVAQMVKNLPTLQETGSGRSCHPYQRCCWPCSQCPLPPKDTARKSCSDHPIVVANTTQKGYASLATVASSSDCTNLPEISWPQTQTARGNSRKTKILKTTYCVFCCCC